MLDAGHGSRLGVERNIAGFQDVMFRPRAAAFHASTDISTTVLGHRIAMPALLSSTGALIVAHSDGDAGVARAAGALSLVSGATGTPIEELMAAATGPVFYQLDYIRGREASAPISERVKRAGVAAHVLSVDTSALPPGEEIPHQQRGFAPTGTGLRDALRFAPSALAKPAWLLDNIRHGGGKPKVAMGIRADGQPKDMVEGLANIFVKTPTRGDLPWIREHWDGPIIIKGLLTTEDARRAVHEGVDAIVVSNNGGNVLEGAVTTLPVLPHIVDAVDGELEVLMDSGVRSGSDVVKAVALGARAVLLGRSYVHGLEAAGEPGVTRVLELFRSQIAYTVATLGLDPSTTSTRRFFNCRRRGASLTRRASWRPTHEASQPASQACRRRRTGTARRASGRPNHGASRTARRDREAGGDEQRATDNCGSSSVPR